MSSFSAFQYPDYVRFQASRALTMTSSQMQGLVVGIQIYEMTRDPIHLGYVGLSLFVPSIMFSLITGHTADRFDRRGIIATCAGVQALASATLLTLTLCGVFTLWPYYLALFLVGTARAFAAPASQALLPNLVPRKDFANAVTWSTSMWQFATIVGPSIGGLVYGLGSRLGDGDPHLQVLRGASCVYAITSLLFAVGAFSLLSIRTRTGRSEQRATSIDTVFAGVHFVLKKKLILGVMSLDLFAVLLGGATALLPVYAKEILHIGPFMLGILKGAPAVGALGVALAVSHLPPMKRAGSLMLWSVGGFGILTVVFGLSTNFWVSLLALAGLGATDMVSVIIRHTVVQLNTPTEMQGRVAAVNSVFINASNELGEFESGITASWWGPVAAVVFGGVGTVISVIACAVLFPELRRYGSLTGDHTGDKVEEPVKEPEPAAT